MSIGWLGWALTIVAAAAVFVWRAHRSWQETAAEIARTRPNLDETQFIAALAPDVAPDTARWLREELDVCFDPLAPHPDDQLLAEFCDPDDISDLVNSFIKQHRLDPAKLAPLQAPDGTLTVRQLAQALEAMLDRGDTADDRPLAGG